jgi:hypothetical protein
LYSGVLILNWNYPQCLICAECNEQQMQHKLPWKSIKSNVLLEWTQCNLFNKVHLNQALLVFLH